MGGMSAVTDGAETVERGNAERRGEIAVRAAAGGGFTKREPHLFGERFGARKKPRTVFSLHGRAIEAAVDFELCAAMDGLECMQAFFEGAHVGSAPGA